MRLDTGAPLGDGLLEGNLGSALLDELWLEERIDAHLRQIALDDSAISPCFPCAVFIERQSIKLLVETKEDIGLVLAPESHKRREVVC